MTEDDAPPGAGTDADGESSADDRAGTNTAVDAGGQEPTVATAEPGAMRARTWTIAATFRAPADYDIPPLPEWTVFSEAGGGMALAAPDSDDAFITADDPMTVRR